MAGWVCDPEPESFLSLLTTPSPTVDSLGISDELKDKLEDVLIPEQQFTLGRMLGKGRWCCAGIGLSGLCCVSVHEWSLLYLDVFGCSHHSEGVDLGQLPYTGCAYRLLS